MNDLTRLDATVAEATHCPNAPICVWSSFYNSPQREKAVRADEAMRWQRLNDRLVTRVELLEFDNARLRAELAAEITK